MPGLNVVINLYKLSLLPTPSVDKASVTITIGLTISCSDNRLSGKCAIGQILIITHLL